MCKSFFSFSPLPWENSFLLSVSLSWVRTGSCTVWHAPYVAVHPGKRQQSAVQPGECLFISFSEPWRSLLRRWGVLPGLPHSACLEAVKAVILGVLGFAGHHCRPINHLVLPRASHAIRMMVRPCYSSEWLIFLSNGMWFESHQKWLHCWNECYW